MGNAKIKSIKFNNSIGFIINTRDGQYKYSNQGYISMHKKTKDIIDNPELIQDLLKKGYTKFKLFVKGENEKEVNTFNINKYINDFKVEGIVFRKYLTSSEVLKNFTYRVTLQVCGKHITEFYPLSKGMTPIDENIITFKTDKGLDVRPGYFDETDTDPIFGKKYKTENAGLSDFGRYPYEFRKPVSEIEKIILTKEYRDVEQIGTEDEYRLNGKKDILELDLHKPDMEVYEAMRAIDNCIEITWE